jgi:hypothetical protein
MKLERFDMAEARTSWFKIPGTVSLMEISRTCEDTERNRIGAM